MLHVVFVERTYDFHLVECHYKTLPSDIKLFTVSYLNHDHSNIYFTPTRFDTDNPEDFDFMIDDGYTKMIVIKHIDCDCGSDEEESDNFYTDNMYYDQPLWFQYSNSLIEPNSLDIIIHRKIRSPVISFVKPILMNIKLNKTKNVEMILDKVNYELSNRRYYDLSSWLNDVLNTLPRTIFNDLLSYPRYVDLNTLSQSTLCTLDDLSIVVLNYNSTIHDKDHIMSIFNDLYSNMRFLYHDGVLGISEEDFIKRCKEHNVHFNKNKSGDYNLSFNEFISLDFKCKLSDVFM